jgi:hypothetical protein
VRSLTQVHCLINSLTNNEDYRQDLWVHYLSGKPVESFEARLVRLKVEYSDHTELRERIWELINNPPPESLSSMIEINFTDYERTIICLLMLGLDVSQISEQKGISEVRIRQSIAVIRYNKCWKENYGTKEESDR